MIIVKIQTPDTMTKPHPYQPPAYHNPQEVDESVVPAGWRMLYEYEFPLRFTHARRCRIYVVPENCFGDRETCTGALSYLTYIIPVAP